MELPLQLKDEVDELLAALADGVALVCDDFGYRPASISVFLELDAEAVTLPGMGSGRHHLSGRDGHQGDA